MHETTICSLDAVARGSFQVKAFHFGNPLKKNLAIVAGLRGSEIQQIYIASQLVRKLHDLHQLVSDDHGVCIIPAANPHAANTARRFWEPESLDLNRLFPGFERGDSAQRVANSIMEHVSGYEYGINLTSINHPGAYANHIRIHRTGWEKVEHSKAFGFSTVHLHEPNAQESGSLNYNWQVWNTKTYSLLGGRAFEIDAPRAQDSINAILRFMQSCAILGKDPAIALPKATTAQLVEDQRLLRINIPRAGIFIPFKELDDRVHKGEVLGTVRDALHGEVLCDVTSPCEGTIFYRFPGPLAYENMVGFTVVVD